MEPETKITAFLLGILCGQFIGFVTAMLVTILTHSAARRWLDKNQPTGAGSGDIGREG